MANQAKNALPSGPTNGSITSLLVNDEHRATRVRQYRCGNAAHEVPDDSRASVGAHHDHAHVVLFGGVNYSAPRWCTLRGQSTCVKTCVSRERRTERSSLFSGPTDFARYSGVKVAISDRCKADIGKLPYAESDCVASGRELAPRALDGQGRKVGAVVGEKDRARRCRRIIGTVGHVSHRPAVRPPLPGLSFQGRSGEVSRTAVATPTRDRPEKGIDRGRALGDARRSRCR